MNLTLMGLPETGKGTQAEKVINTYGIPYISTGNMLRTAMKNGTALGLEAGSYIDKSELVPDEVANGIVKECLAGPDTDRGSLLDGSPRTLNRARILDTMLKELGKKIDAVIDIHVKGDVLIERLAGQFICRICGAAYHRSFNPPKVEGTCDHCGGHEFYQGEDDKPETVRNRLAVNTESSVPILVFYKEQGLMCTIDGNHEIDAIFSDVRRIIGGD